MTGAVHASIGAGVGSFCKNKSTAFVSGVISHLVADMLPHKDLSPAIEVPLLLGALAGIAAWKGLDSPEFWGAVGGVIPDSEHALLLAGLIDETQEIFPTHIDNGKWHGPENGERISQILIAAAALAAVVLNEE